MRFAIGRIGKGGQVNDGFRGMIHEKGVNHLLVGDVKLLAVERYDLMGEAKKTSGAASDESGCACDKNLHCEKKDNGINAPPLR